MAGPHRRVPSIVLRTRDGGVIVRSTGHDRDPRSAPSYASRCMVLHCILDAPQVQVAGLSAQVPGQSMEALWVVNHGPPDRMAALAVLCTVPHGVVCCASQDRMARGTGSCSRHGSTAIPVVHARALRPPGLTGRECLPVQSRAGDSQRWTLLHPDPEYGAAIRGPHGRALHP